MNPAMNQCLVTDLRHCKFNARPASLRSLTPTVARKTGATDYTAGYDVRNAMTLAQVLHSGFDAYKWGIITVANQLRTFNFTMPQSDLTDGPIRIPARGVFPGAETYYQDQFPDPALFRFHFEECVRRNFRAEGEGSAKPKEPEVDAADPVGAGDETSDVEEGDWSSMDMSTVASQKIWRGMMKQVASTDTIIQADDLEMSTSNSKRKFKRCCGADGIQPSSSPWGAPVLFVKKKGAVRNLLPDGGLRRTNSPSRRRTALLLVKVLSIDPQQSTSAKDVSTIVNINGAHRVTNQTLNASGGTLAEPSSTGTCRLG
ncbi:uncharacterized protein EV422DRAFT_572096 [Fimicolochytrium jonesii]|uniref:uncharacterized protein n=1 Tax=Fimicolochytrium jonesii TaxID=1396493 RepID=UPI0022FEA5FE|nr:uncharacterized protein EV422DRAFT_572096 [Fimicolochytrium jonesii]KAI8816035.1 hypothetical protein EV422DRAFT_572096 [Fimicolochytrium jonesii]